MSLDDQFWNDPKAKRPVRLHLNKVRLPGTVQMAEGMPVTLADGRAIGKVSSWTPVEKGQVDAILFLDDPEVVQALLMPPKGSYTMSVSNTQIHEGNLMVAIEAAQAATPKRTKPK